MNDQDKRIDEILDAVLERQPDDLDAFLDERCPADLRPEVEDLLSRREAVDSSEFVLEPIGVPVTLLLEHQGESGNTEANILIGAVAFQRGDIDLQQFEAVCRTWASDRSVPLPELLVEREWIDEATKSELVRLAEQERLKYGDVHVTLGAVANSRARDAVRGLDDPNLAQTINRLPPLAGHVLTETIANSNGTDSRYLLTKLHAKGGLGEVWVAHDEELNRDVAFKRLQKQRGMDDHIQRRFLKEAQVTGQLGHPNIVPVYELGRDEKHGPFYTMRLVKGETLQEAIAKYHATRQATKSDPVELQRLLNAFVSVCNAIYYAHSCGVLHRDLKPANVVLGGFGEVIVLDWGLAKLADDDQSSNDNTVASHIDIEATATGALLGTPSYMAPEQAAGDQSSVTTLTDVYGLGSILFEILTGQPPHTSRHGENTQELLERIRAGAAPVATSRGVHVPKALSAICAKAMEKEPHARYPNVRMLLQDVEQWMADRPVTAYRDSPGERVARFTRKHRTATQAVTMTTLLIAVVAIAAAYLINAARINEQTQREAAEVARNKAVTLAGEKADALEQVQTQQQLAESHRLNAVAKAEYAAQQAMLAEQRMSQLQRATYNMTLQNAAQIVRKHPSEALAFLTSEGKCAPHLRDFTWRHLYRLTAGRLRELFASDDETNHTFPLTIRFDESGRLICLMAKLGGGASRPHSIEKWRVETATKASWPVTINEPTTAVALSASGSMVAIGTKSGEIVLWDAQQKEERGRLKTSGEVTSLSFSPDGRQLASAHHNNAHIWSLTTLTQRREFSEGSPRMIAFSPDSSRVITAGKATSVWDADTGERLRSFGIQHGLPLAIATSGNSNLVAVGGQGVHVLDIRTGAVVRSFTPGELSLAVTSVAISPDGDLLAVGTIAGRIDIFNIATSEAASREGYSHSSAVSSLVFSHDGKHLVSAGLDGSVKVWGLELSLAVDSTASEGTTASITASPKPSAISPDVSLVASADDNKVRLYSTDDLKSPIDELDVTAEIVAMQFDLSGSNLAVGVPDAVSIWNVSERSEICRVPAKKSVWPGTFSLSSDGHELVALQNDGAVKIFDVNEGRETITLGHNRSIQHVLFSPDNTLVAAGDSSGGVLVWEASSGTVVHRLEHRVAGVRMLMFSPDGSRLAVSDLGPDEGGGGSSSTILWNLVDGTKEQVQRTGLSLLPCTAFSANGESTAFGRWNGPVRVIDRETSAIVELDGATEASALAFSHDGRTIAAGSGGSLVFYDALDGQERLRLDTEAGMLVSLEFSRDDRLLAGRTIGGETYLWRADEPMSNEHLPNSQTQTLFVNASATAGGDGTSWGTAFRRVSDAIAHASETEESMTQIWVAGGVYTPAESSNERAASLKLLKGVELYGGFAGDESDVSQRDPTRNLTVLSGDIERDDPRMAAPVGNNSFHVLTALNADRSAVLDGFVIAGGMSDGRSLESHDSETFGAGLLVVNASPTVRNCVFQGNQAKDRGGAVYIYKGEPTFENCRFVDNHATIGGALCNVGDAYNSYRERVTVIGCEFRANRALGGGALYTWWGNPMSIVNCEFVANEAYGSGVYQEGGGAIHNDACRIELVNTVIRNNTSASPGGALKAKWRPQAKLTNCTVVSNESDAVNGGAIHVFNGAFVEVANSILWGNGTQPISLGDAGGGRGVNARFSCIQGGWEGENIIEEDPLLLDAGFGFMRLSSSSPCIDAGSDDQLDEDLVDLDGNGKFFEPTPYDAARLSRFVGQVDLGAYEHQQADAETDHEHHIEYAKFLHAASGLAALPPRDVAADVSSFVDRIEQWGGLITPRFAMVHTAPLEPCVELSNQLKTKGYRPLRFRPYAHDECNASAEMAHRIS